MATAFFAGSFNPFTIGHRDIVERALQMFDCVVIGVGVNGEKQAHAGEVERDSGTETEGATVERDERVERISAAFADDERVTVVAYSGLTAEAARRQGATVLLRSVRSSTDLAYEAAIAEANRREFGLDTAVLMARAELAHVSSSLVRDLSRHGHDVRHLLGW